MGGYELWGRIYKSMDVRYAWLLRVLTFPGPADELDEGAAFPSAEGRYRKGYIILKVGY